MPIVSRRVPFAGAVLFAAAATAQPACVQEAEPPPPTRTIVIEDPIGAPIRDLTPELDDSFLKGDKIFDARFRATQGLGPLYIRQSCASCHASDGKGPGFVTKMVIVAADGSVSPDQSALAFGHTKRPFKSAGATVGIDAPVGADVLVSTRIGPAVFGRGFLEAIDDAEIERGEALQATRTDGISGRIHRVPFQGAAVADPPFDVHAPGDENLIGRFGLKARLSTLDEFSADAFQGDMGLTSPMRPDEPPNPDGLTDDDKPGVDLAQTSVAEVATYMRLLDIPRRTGVEDAGLRVFAAARCDVCHVPALHTRVDYPVAALADIDAPAFTDILLHDMGDALADGLPDLDASGREWRTAPLLGLRHFQRYLHDGRAATLDEAVQLHASEGSEANDSVARYRALSDVDRATLIAFLTTL